MRFRTEITPEKPLFDIDFNRGALFIGSCFSDHIAAKMRQTLWNVCANPCGTLFNPASIARLINISLSPDDVLTETLGNSMFANNGLWNSFLLPTEFSSSDKDEALSKAYTALSRLRAALKSAGTIFITFGTANIYELAGSPDHVVTNCHKLPASTFTRRMMSTGEIITLWKETTAEIRKLNPDCRFIFTVSPVRHIRDGYRLNTLSKGTLLLATLELCDSLQGCCYFPSYELLTDDLRDYRFYADDLVHPSEAAAEYISEKLFATLFTDSQQKVLKEGQSICRRLHHRHMHPGTAEARIFDEHTKALADKFIAAHPGFTAQ